MQPCAASSLFKPDGRWPALLENWMIPSDFESVKPFMAAFSVMMDATSMAGYA